MKLLGWALVAVGGYAAGRFVGWAAVAVALLLLLWSVRRRAGEARLRRLNADVDRALELAAVASEQVARLEDGRKPFDCPLCGARSWNPNDLEQGYCGRCSWWTGDPVLGRIVPPQQRRRGRAS